MTMTTNFLRSVLLTACCVMALAMTTTAAYAQDAVKVIVNSSNPIAEMSAADVSNLFLKKIKKFPGGDAASPIDHAKGSAVRAAFAKAIHGRSVSAVDTYWQQQIFGGGESPPPIKNSDDEIVAFVKATPGGVGYVSSGASVGGVKVVTVK